MRSCKEECWKVQLMRYGYAYALASRVFSSTILSGSPIDPTLGKKKHLELSRMPSRHGEARMK